MALVLAACQDSVTSLPPPVAGDWPVATPAEQGLADGPLRALERDIERGVYGDVHSVLIVRGGHLVFEEYFGEGAPDELHRMYSVTKSVAATLVGMAWDRGLIGDVDRPLLDFFPQYPVLAHPAGKESITLAHALQMRAGIEWNEWSTNYDNPVNITTRMTLADDWFKFVLDQPMGAEPGTTFAYNSGASNLLAGVLRAATGQTTAEFADEVLFGPLGITERAWWVSSDRIAITGWGLHLRSRDMARIGQLYLQRGVWNGTRLLSEEWIAESLEQATRWSDGRGYGYQWWLGPEVRAGGAVAPVAAAQGWGGQFIVVVPAADAVVVTTQGNYAGLQGLGPDRLTEVLLDALTTAGTAAAG